MEVFKESVFEDNCSFHEATTVANFCSCFLEQERISEGLLIILAAVLCPVAYTSRYKSIEKRNNSYCSRSVELVIGLHLLSEVIALAGAVMAYVLIIQIAFGVVMVVTTVCCVGRYISKFLLHKSKSKRKGISGKGASSLKGRFHVCCFPVMLMTLLVGFILFSTDGIQASNKGARALQDGEIRVERFTPLPLRILLGYMFGVIAAIASICSKLVDGCVSTSLGDGHKWWLPCVTTACGVGGDLCYFIAVHIHNTTLDYVYLVLPWTVPRLVSAGLDTGQMIYFLSTKRKRSFRRMSPGDTDTLLSSDIEIDSDESEEVIWTPLHSVTWVQPQYTVCPARVQILSDSDQGPVETESDDGEPQPDEHSSLNSDVNETE